MDGNSADLELWQSVSGTYRVNSVDVPASLPQQGLHSVRPDEVRLGPDRIEWRPSKLNWSTGAPADECLFNFLALADDDDPAAFVSYAAIHGVLGLTENLLPGTHETRECPRVPDDPDWHFEPIHAWRNYAKNAKMLLVLAMELRGSNRIDASEVLRRARIEDENFRNPAPFVRGQFPPFSWVQQSREELGPEFSPELYIEEPVVLTMQPRLNDIYLIQSAPDVEGQRRALMHWLQGHWLDLANITPGVEWASGPPKLVLRLSRRTRRGDFGHAFWPENTLFSVLAAELAGIICSDRYVAACSRCTKLISSQSRVRTDQPRYCESCRLFVRKTTNNESARKRYARQKAECKNSLDSKLTAEPVDPGGRTRTVPLDTPHDDAEHGLS